MYQWLLFSKVFLVFVFLDVLVVVNTAEAQNDDLAVKDSAFSEVIKNITRVNNVLQELIKNYEKLQKIYHSQESIDQEYGSQDEIASNYGKNQRSKYIATPAKPKDFPGTNMPFEELDGSPEDVDKENKISTGKSHEGRAPNVEAHTHNNNKDKAKEKQEKVKTTEAKDPNKKLADTLVETDSSSDMTEEKLDKQKKKLKESKEIKEHEVSKNTKGSEKARTKPNTEQKGVTVKKVISEYGSMERPKRNSTNGNLNFTDIVMKSRYSPVNDETAEPYNDVFYKQRKRLDDNKHVFNPFATESRDEKKSAPKIKSVSKKTVLRFGTIDKSSTKKKEVHVNKNHKKDIQKKEISSEQIKIVTQLFSHRADDKQEDHKKVHQKEVDKEIDIVASSEDEKSIKKEQFKTSILRKAYGDACLKVVVKKCYKACKGTLKRACKTFKCKSNFQLQFKEHAKTGCICNFRDNATTKPAVVAVEQPKPARIHPLKEGNVKEETPNVRAMKDGDIDFDGFSDLTRDGYLAAACLPKSRRTDGPQSSSDKQLNILRDRFERECQKVSCSKCGKACAYAVDKACSTFNCSSDKKSLLKKYCKRECRDSYRSKSKKKKNKSSRSDSSDSRSRSRSGSSDTSGSDTDTDFTDTSISSEKKHTKTTIEVHYFTPNATKKDETKLKLRTGHTHKDRDATKMNDRVPKTNEQELFYRAQETKAWKHQAEDYDTLKFRVEDIDSQEVWKYEKASKKKTKRPAKLRAEDTKQGLTKLRAESTTSHEVWTYEPEKMTVKVRLEETKKSVTPIYVRADHLKS